MKTLAFLTAFLAAFPALAYADLTRGFSTELPPEVEDIHKERRISVSWEEPYLVARQGWDESLKEVKIHILPSSQSEFFYQLDSDPEYEYVVISRGSGTGPYYTVYIVDFVKHGILSWVYYSSGAPHFKNGKIYLGDMPDGYQGAGSTFSYTRYIYTAQGLVKQEEGLPRPQLGGNAVVDFTEDTWRIVNDRVMGGRSTSQMTVGDGGVAVFSGELSLENNGGFASVRRRSRDLSFAGCTGVMLRVKGDGRTYQLRVRTDDRTDGVAYRAEFETKAGEWIEVKLTFAAMEPTFRGRKMPDAPPLKAEDIRQIGFLIGDKKAGPFRLEIDWIKAYEEEGEEQ